MAYKIADPQRAHVSDLLPYIPFKMDYFRKGIDEWVNWIIAEVEANKK